MPWFRVQGLGFRLLKDEAQAWFCGACALESLLEVPSEDMSEGRE